MQITNHYKEDHSKRGLKQLFICDKYANKFIQTQHLIRHVRTSATKSVEGSKSKDAGPAREAKEECGSHESKFSFDRLCGIQEVMDINSTSIIQRQVARQE